MGRDGLDGYALAGVDVEAPLGPSTLKITVMSQENGVTQWI